MHAQLQTHGHLKKYLQWTMRLYSSLGTHKYRIVTISMWYLMEAMHAFLEEKDYNNKGFS